MTLRVFLVEDSPVIRENLAAAMEELAPVQIVGFAEDEPTAAAWLASNPRGADLLVIDLFLKRGSGLKFLRAAANTTAASRVVLSNYATLDMRRKCLELGADRVFDKSNEIEALIAFCARLDGGETVPDRLPRQQVKRA
jgi:DNA-binding NarL/FixJ family response regulator